MQIIEDRRRLHQIPELDRNLPQTLAYLRGALAGQTLFSPTEDSLCVFFDFGGRSTLAFRADMDALPIQEKTGLPFASVHPGKMHACGHDGHMAMLLELARRLSAVPVKGRNILLIFQPAEETTGGAKAICDSGVLADYGVEAIFGMHLWPGLPAGAVYSRMGPMMSRSCEVTVEITGKSAHIARASEGLDALAAGVDFYTRVRKASEEIGEYHVLRFGQMESGTVRNAVSGATVLRGTMRSFSDETFTALRQALHDAAGQTAQATRCGVQVHTGEGYPAVNNPPSLYDRVKQAASFSILPKPSLITEDFSWYQRYVPGMFFFLGTGDTPALHAAEFTFDETILTKGADFWETLARELI